MPSPMLTRALQRLQVSLRRGRAQASLPLLEAIPQDEYNEWLRETYLESPPGSYPSGGKTRSRPMNTLPGQVYVVVEGAIERFFEIKHIDSVWPSLESATRHVEIIINLKPAPKAWVKRAYGPIWVHQNEQEYIEVEEHELRQPSWMHT